MEVLDAAGTVLEPYGKANTSALVGVDQTKIAIKWQHGLNNLAAIAGQVQLIHLTHSLLFEHSTAVRTYR